MPSETQILLIRDMHYQISTCLVVTPSHSHITSNNTHCKAHQTIYSSVSLSSSPPPLGNSTAIDTATALGQHLVQTGKYSDAVHVLRPLHDLNRTDSTVGYALAVSLTTLQR